MTTLLEQNTGDAHTSETYTVLEKEPQGKEDYYRATSSLLDSKK